MMIDIISISNSIKIGVFYGIINNIKYSEGPQRDPCGTTLVTGKKQDLIYVTFVH